MKTAQRIVALSFVTCLTAVSIAACRGKDCTTGDGKVAFDEGVQQATNDMNTAAARGRADAAALTYEQGYSKGYPQDYTGAYQQGHASPAGYTTGYNQGKAEGIVIGGADAASYNQGLSAGATAGYSQGWDDGSYDGYWDGYLGYDDPDYGHVDGGYDYGWSEGLAACLGNGSSEKKRNACRNDGYKSAYDSKAYQAAYDAGVIANTDYNDGIADGKTQGFIDGYGAGVAQGKIDGRAAGQIDGIEQGKQVAYTDGYNLAYQYGYTDSSNQDHGGYYDGYSNGYNDLTYGYGELPTLDSYENGTGGLGDGFYDGYIDGYYSCQNAAKAAPGSQAKAKGPRRMGTGSKANAASGVTLPWAKAKTTKTNGKTIVDAHGPRPLPSTLSKAAKAALEKGKAAKRSGLRLDKAAATDK